MTKISGYVKYDDTHRVVFVDDNYLSPRHSLKIVNHSPDGFSWGYAGSGPAQLAFAILLEVVGAEKAKKHYQDFKDEFIVPLDIDSDFIIEVDIEKWIEDYE